MNQGGFAGYKLLKVNNCFFRETFQRDLNGQAINVRFAVRGGVFVITVGADPSAKLRLIRNRCILWNRFGFRENHIIFLRFCLEVMQSTKVGD